MTLEAKREAAHKTYYIHVSSFTLYRKNTAQTVVTATELSQIKR
jgi:hypothetical protein